MSRSQWRITINPTVSKSKNIKTKRLKVYSNLNMDLEHFLNKIFIYISGFNRDWSTRTEAKIRTIRPNL